MNVKSREYESYIMTDTWSGLKQGLRNINKEVISGDGEVYGLMHGQPWASDSKRKDGDLKQTNGIKYNRVEPQPSQPQAGT